MTDENNNADFDSAVGETHPTLVPAPEMTREEFVNKAKQLLDEMLVDHEEQTGMADSETQDWGHWMDDLTAAYINQN